MAKRTDAKTPITTTGSDPFEDEAPVAVAAPPVPLPAPAPQPSGFTIQELVLKLPMAKEPEGYLTMHIEVGSLTERQRIGLGKLRRGMAAKGLMLECRRMVTTNNDVIRYLLEQVP